MYKQIKELLTWLIGANDVAGGLPRAGLTSYLALCYCCLISLVAIVAGSFFAVYPIPNTWIGLPLPAWQFRPLCVCIAVAGVLMLVRSIVVFCRSLR